METVKRFSYVNNYGKGYDEYVDVVVRDIMGRHKSGVCCDDVRCCCTRWEVYESDPREKLFGGRYYSLSTYEIPRCIEFKIGKKILEGTMERSDVNWENKDEEQWIKINCIHRCDIDVSEYGSDGLFTKENIYTMAYDAIGHAYKCHHDHCKTRQDDALESELCRHLDKCHHDLKFDGICGFKCQLGEQCQYPMCIEMRKYNITNHGFMYNVAFQHHQFCHHKECALLV